MITLQILVCLVFEALSEQLNNQKIEFYSNLRTLHSFCDDLMKMYQTELDSKSRLKRLIFSSISQVKLGSLVQTESSIDDGMIESLKAFASSEFSELPVLSGTTMSTTEFYEGQGRTDGAFCDFTLKDRENYLNQLKKDGVMNIEMEANAFVALCHKAGIKCAVINVVLVNRLQGDQVKISKEEYKEYQKRPVRFAIKYILKRLLN